jgi:uncharacterized protein (TIGR02001 family)
VLRCVVVFLGLAYCGTARAQASVSATLSSDYRYRGISLSNGKPAAQLGLAWEHPDGWFAGGMMSSTRLSDHAGVQLLSYLGLARRMRNGLSWEGGVQYVTFTGHSEDRYREFFVGLAADHVSLRAYFQAAFMGPEGAGVYVEANGARELGEHVQLIGHLGWGWRPEAAEPPHFDARAGIGTMLGNWATQLAFVFNDGNSVGYTVDPDSYDARDRTLVVSVSRTW